MSKPTTVAVVVVARNEAELITRCIGSIAAQSRQPDQVILVDDGSSDDTIALARAAFPGIEVLAHHTRSLARNRNSGWQAAKTEFVAFLDADCEAPAHWLDSLLRAAQESGFDVVGGGNAPPQGESTHFDALAIMLDNVVGSRGSVQGQVPREPREVDHLPTLNVMYRRSALVRVGGFDAGFTQIGEDEDLSRRLAASGSRFLAIADATVIHRQRADIGSWARNMHKYGKGRTWLLRRHPQAFSPVFWAPPLMWPLLPLYLPAIALVALYLCVAHGRVWLWPRVTALFVATHLPYGAGQVAGLFERARPERHKRKRIGLIALKNAGNKGDEAIVRAVSERVTRENGEADFYLAAFGPSGFAAVPLPRGGEALDAVILKQLTASDTSRDVRPARLVLDAMRALRVFGGFDALFISGGQWLHDLSFARHAAISALFVFGRMCGTQLGVFCIGVGPLKRAVSRRLVRLAFGKRALMVTRDDKSSALLRDCGLTNVHTATDPVILLSSPLAKRDAKSALISPCAWASFANLYDRSDALRQKVEDGLATLTRGLLERGYSPAFLPTMNPEDAEIAARVAARFENVNVIDTDPMSASAVQQCVASAGVLVTMRLHPMIFATNVTTPLVAFDYAAKVRAFASQAGITDQLVPATQEDWAQGLLDALDRSDPEAFRAALADHRPAQKASLEAAYATLSSWFPNYDQRAMSHPHSDEKNDAHRLC